MNNVIIATAFFFVTLIVSRAITNKANQKLDAAKKAELVDLFAKNRLSRFIFLAAVIILFLVNAKYQFVSLLLSFAMYVVFLAGFMAYVGYQSYRELKAHDFPGEYLRNFILASVLRFTGLILFVVLIMLAK